MPLQSEALFLQANDLIACGALAEAGQCLRQALALDPRSGAVHANLAFLKERAGALDAAEALYRQAIALLPDDAQLYMNLGMLLLKLKRFGEAEEVSRLAAYLAPQSPAAWSNLGVLLACMQRDAEAEQCYKTALQREPGHARAQFNLAYVLLRQGRLREGFPLLQARWQFDHLANAFTCPRWHGEALHGKSIVIGCEAGQGDMIQFCRYTALLRARGAARIDLVCHPGLVALLATLPGVGRVFSFRESLPDGGWDCWTLPMSLPAIFATTLETIPAPIPYLTPDPARVREWAACLPARGLRVGLAWRGNPAFENDAERSLPHLSVLAPLAGVKGVCFVSLQQGPGHDDAPPPAMELYLAGPSLRDFADTAALIANLDLVISVDTAVAHLAGALGTPCWLLLPDYRADWRWLTQRSDTPWYPGTMRLFRQPRGGGWASVAEELATALRERRALNV